MAEKLLTEEDFNELLQKLTKNPNVTYVSSKWQQYSKDGKKEGFTGEYYVLDVDYMLGNEKKSEKCFVKAIILNNEIVRKITESSNSYKKEILFSKILIEEYEKYNIDTSFAAKCYFSKNDQLLVLENLIPKQFKLAEKYKLYDLNHCEISLKALAQFHGSNLIYEEIKSKELGKKYKLSDDYSELLKESLYDVSNGNDFTKMFVEKGIKNMKFIYNKMKREKNYKDEFENELISQKVFSAFIEDKEHMRKTTGHGDLWFKNIFFKYENSKAVKCSIIDYQMLRYFYPAYDVLLLIYLNTSREFRETHLKYLLQFYYDSLSEILEHHDLDIKTIFPLKEYKESLSFVEFSVLYNAANIISFVNLSDDTLNAIDDIDFDDTEKYFKIVSEHFENDKFYRKLVLDALDDFYLSFYKDKTKEFF